MGVVRLLLHVCVTGATYVRTYVTSVMDWCSGALHLASFLFILACVSDAARYSIVDTTIGGVLAAKRIQNDDTGEFSLSLIAS